MKMKAVYSPSLAMNFYRLQSIISQKTVHFSEHCNNYKAPMCNKFAEEMLQPIAWPAATQGMRRAVGALIICFNKILLNIQKK
jgi:hypothetical protein